MAKCATIVMSGGISLPEVINPSLPYRLSLLPPVMAQEITYVSHLSNGTTWIQTNDIQSLESVLLDLFHSDSFRVVINTKQYLKDLYDENEPPLHQNSGTGSLLLVSPEHSEDLARCLSNLDRVGTICISQQAPLITLTHLVDLHITVQFHEYYITFEMTRSSGDSHRLVLPRISSNYHGSIQQPLSDFF